MKNKIDFLANINQQFESISVRSSPGNSGIELEIIQNQEEEDTESDDEKNEKDTKNEIKTIIKTIDSEFNFNYNQTFTSTNSCEIRCKLILKLQKSLALKFRPSVTQLTKWFNTTARMRNSGKLLKDLCRKKICRIKVAKELFRKNNPNITNYDKELLLRMLVDRAEMSDTGEKNNSKIVVNVYDLS
ncbi:hypothetical protein Glove_95g5 [Diversispora epigaea]|uniref:Uncharacterized protein n=1 Tax=Diversispora epigaea TaxID=1348612 RepID=A0A397J8L9_9GLOM|nr:hypothetical protein Glove_95g5 [Diversispora epigaea]